ncbi:MAG: 6-carboxytetrahydropterin synthase, partial [Phycisphaerales bacterium]|nr:6-carboxytetrahydropterin synthase [Phycisphaerales bacterium]
MTQHSHHPVLSRTVRFCLSQAGSAMQQPRHNTFAGWPPMIGMGAAWAITVEVEGAPDAETGYLLGIDRIDAATRDHVVPWLLERWRMHPEGEPSHLLPGVLERLQPEIKVPIRAVELQPEPMGRFRIEAPETSMVTIIRRFSFSASHRLAIPGRSDAENEALYGKCSNPNGHGHNYEVEVAVTVPLQDPALNPLRVDEIVDTVLINRFDHKHLNEDLTDFNDRTASVENIAARCSELLTGPISAEGGTLRRVTVWETPRTACTIETSAPH